MNRITRNRKLKKCIVLAFALLLIAAGALTVILAIAMRGGMRASTLWTGVGFGAFGIVMLLLYKFLPGEPYAPVQTPSPVPDGTRARTAAPDHPAPQKRSGSPMPPPHKPYPRDPRKPAGSKENPIIVGMPEYSTTLVHDAEHNRWILTDGLGNGWIR